MPEQVQLVTEFSPRQPEQAGQAPAVILRLEDLPATPGNVERIRERVRQLNRQLADSGTPFRLRVI